MPPAQFLAEFLLTILIRSKVKPEGIVAIYKCVERFLIESEFSEWLLEMLSQVQITQELLVFCPIFIMRKLVVSLAKEAVSRISLQKAMWVFLRLAQNVRNANKKHSKHFSQFWELIKHLALVFPEMAHSLDLPNKMVRLVLRHTIDFPTPKSGERSHLGYDSSEYSPEIPRDEGFYTDSREVSLIHIYEYIYCNSEYLTEETKEVLFTSESFEIVLRDVDTKATAWWIGNLFGHLCVDNPERSHQYISYLMDNFKLTEFYFRTKYLKLLTTYFVDGDSLFP